MALEVCMQFLMHLCSKYCGPKVDMYNENALRWSVITSMQYSPHITHFVIICAAQSNTV